jgi:hypothetical protein
VQAEHQQQQEQPQQQEQEHEQLLELELMHKMCHENTHRTARNEMLEQHVSTGDFSPEDSAKYNNVRTIFPTSLEDRFLATENFQNSPNTAESVFRGYQKM